MHNVMSVCHQDLIIQENAVMFLYRGGLGAGVALFGQCGDIQVVPPWVGGGVVTSVILVLQNEINVHPNPTAGLVYIQGAVKLTSCRCIIPSASLFVE